MTPVRMRWLLVAPVFLMTGLALLRGQELPTSKRPPQPNVLANVSRDFANDVIQKTIENTEPLYDEILDTPLYGTVQSTALLGVEFLPCPNRAVLAVTVQGEGYTKSLGVSGPVQLFGEGTVSFLAQKRVFFDGSTIKPGKSWAMVQTNNSLRDIRTVFESGLPDHIARRIAYETYQEKRAQAEYIANRHGEVRLLDRLDAEMDPKVWKSNEDYAKYLRNLKKELGLPLDDLRLSTTTTTLEARAVVGDGEKTGKLAPPPELGKSPYLALRVHESAINNVAQALLGGKTISGTELAALLSGIPDLPSLKPAKGAKPWSITFHSEKPVRVAFAEQRFAVRVHAKEFRSGINVLKAVEILAVYKFDEGPKGNRLVRQGLVEVFLTGARPGEEKKLSDLIELQRQLLQQSLSTFLPEELRLAPVELPTDFGNVRQLALSRADTDNGWLALTWRKAAGKRNSSTGR